MLSGVVLDSTSRRAGVHIQLLRTKENASPLGTNTYWESSSAPPTAVNTVSATPVERTWPPRNCERDGKIDPKQP